MVQWVLNLSRKLLNIIFKVVLGGVRLESAGGAIKSR